MTANPISVPANPALFRWAREKAGLTLEQAARRAQLAQLCPGEEPAAFLCALANLHRWLRANAALLGPALSGPVLSGTALSGLKPSFVGSVAPTIPVPDFVARLQNVLQHPPASGEAGALGEAEFAGGLLNARAAALLARLRAAGVLVILTGCRNRALAQGRGVLASLPPGTYGSICLADPVAPLIVLSADIDLNTFAGRVVLVQGLCRLFLGCPGIFAATEEPSSGPHARLCQAVAAACLDSLDVLDASLPQTATPAALDNADSTEAPSLALDDLLRVCFGSAVIDLVHRAVLEGDLACTDAATLLGVPVFSLFAAHSSQTA